MLQRRCSTRLWSSLWLASCGAAGCGIQSGADAGSVSDASSGAADAPDAASVPAPSTGDTDAGHTAHAPVDASAASPAPVYDAGPRPEPTGGFVSVSGHVNGGLMGAGSMSEPVMICEHTRPQAPCVETDATGVFIIEVPDNSQVALRFIHPELTPTLRAFLTTEAPLELGNTRVASISGLASVASALGYENDAAGGALFFAGIIDVSAQVEGDADADGFYLDMRGTLVPEAHAMLLRGTAGYMNLTPGEQRLRFSHPDNPCSFRGDNTLSGWPVAGEPDVAIAPVLAGHHTHMLSMYCGEP